MIEHSYANLPNHFYCPAHAASFSDPKIFLFNENLLNQLDIESIDFKNETNAALLSGNIFLPNSRPIAMAYAGHQFGHFVPSLGDGRAMLLGEFLNRENVRYDLHLKGSGRTCFSRNGDGKCALGPAIREYLISEFMYAVKIPTTRSLAVVTTGESIFRETEVRGAVLARMALGHIRIGTFQYFSYRHDYNALKLLADYCIARFYPEINLSNNPYLYFWKSVALKQIKLIAQWMSVGFIHGVMNTDNISIAGETIDYGPCAFMDHYESNKVFSFIDKNGRYAFNHQPNIILWNLAKLAESLFPLLNLPEEHFRIVISEELQVLQKSIWDKFYHLIIQKMGLAQYTESSKNLAISWLNFLESEKLDFTLGFIELERILENKATHTNLIENENFQFLYNLWQDELRNEARNITESINQMKQLNASFIPRNHIIENIIQSAYKENLTSKNQLLEKFLKNLTSPFKRYEKLTSDQLPPSPDEIVQNTFCGT